jgi:hypothetical protein
MFLIDDNKKVKKKKKKQLPKFPTIIPPHIPQIVTPPQVPKVPEKPTQININANMETENDSQAIPIYKTTPNKLPQIDTEMSPQIPLYK